MQWILLNSAMNRLKSLLHIPAVITETACEALEKGVNHMTHLYNAMPGINHRNPGSIIAALEAGAEGRTDCRRHPYPPGNE